TRQQRPAVAGVFVLVAAVFVGSILWQARALKYQQLTLGEKLVFYKEGALATVSVKEDSKGWRTIYVDDVGVAGTDPVLQTDQKTLAHVPMILLGGKAERTLTVGFGSGGASWSYTLYPDIKEIDAIEITTTVPEAAPSLTDANHGIVFPRRVIEEARKTMAPGDHLPGAVHPLGDYTVAANRQFMTFDPRYRIIVDDARSYLRFTSRVYDVIATDCTDLRYKTNANLYDREYFNLCRDRISDRGLVVVWTPLAGLSDEAFRIVVRTFREVFPDMTVWYFTNQPTHYCLFIGQKGGVKINYGDVLHALELPAIQKDLEEIGLRDPAKLVASFVTDQRGIDAYVGTGPLNTEDFPIIEFLSPRYGYDSTPVAINMGRLYDVQVPVWDLVVDRTEESLRGQPRIADIQQANDILFQGHVQYREHNFLDACKLYEKARKIAPHDKSIDDLLEFEELRLLLEWELKRTVTVTDAQWTNAQWIAWQLGSIFEFQKRYPDAVSTVMPFANRVPPPETGDLPDDLRQSGYALNVLLARCYAAVKNETRAREFFNTAKAYEPNRPDWPKIEDEVFGVP
ncbi:hypothetical protein HZA57_06255, partial [Candidatus Poribacteria bacterium]|nr:hypothetical protein [Candidatus Poribacteria bacterium]